MNTSVPQKSTSIAKGNTRRAIVVLPGRASDGLTEQADKQWLASASFRSLSPTAPMLERLLAELDLPPPQAAPAALRWWGQTGECPEGWVAGADPVWMQAGMDKITVHVPPAGEFDDDSLRDLLGSLQTALFDDDQYTLASHGVMGYLRGAVPLLTARLPATAIDRSRPDVFMPDINDAAARGYYSLCSEIEMTLHEHPFNAQREQRGQRPLNALWLWGGGTIQQTEPQALPPVFTDDAMLKGYCSFSDAPCYDVPASLNACCEQAPQGFVVAYAGTELPPLRGLVEEIKMLWKSRRLQHLTILFDNVAVDVERGFRNLFRRSGKKQLRKFIRDNGS